MVASFSTSSATYGRPNCITVSETDPEVGSNTANFLSKWNGSALVTSQVYDNGTNIGIGNSSPGAKLDVTGDLRLTNFRTQSATRAVPTTVNDAVDIGSFAFTNG